jgi:hypothetical protein
MHARQIIDLFGGQSSLARILGKSQSTVSYWAKTGVIPAKWQATLIQLAREHKIDLSPTDFVAASINPQPATPKTSENKNLVAIQPARPAAPSPQGRLDLGIAVEKEIDGIGMGVLTDGTPYLAGRGLARLTGVVHSVIQDITTEFQAPDDFPRVKRIREIMQSHGASTDRLFIPIQQRSGLTYAYPDVVCLAILEYYAFDAAVTRPEAIKNYRLLAGYGLRDLIYTQVGYDPKSKVPEQWKQFHDRVSLTYNKVPHGYFGIFKEIADMIVTLGQNGAHINAKFVPDISVGIAWSDHWKKSKLQDAHGERIKYEHNYPEYFPQSLSNPQEPWCYPEGSLGEFRRWFREDYVGQGKFKKYLDGKVKDNTLPVSFAQLAIAAYVQD